MPTAAEAQHSVPSNVRRITRRPIDMMHLARQALGDAALEVEILRMFAETIDVHFGRLETAVTVPDLLHHLNTLKGAAVGVGAWSLAEHVHIMTHDLKSGRPVNPEQVEDIHIAVAEVQVFIAGLVATADAADEAGRVREN
jgi:hypothetical protein